MEKKLVLLVLLGTLLVLNPLYLFPNAGEPRQILSLASVSNDNVSDEDTVAFSELSDEEQRAVETALEERRYTARGEHPSSLAFTEESNVIQYHGEYYKLHVAHTDPGLSPYRVVQETLRLLGVGAAVVGLFQLLH